MTYIPPTTVARWQALSDRRLGHMAELQRTGRWRLIYPTKDAFAEALRAANVDTERWKSISCVESPPIAAAEG